MEKDDNMFKKIIAVACSFCLILSSFACSDSSNQGNVGEQTDMTNDNTENKVVEDNKEITIAKKGEKTEFVLAYDFSAGAQLRSDMAYLKEALEEFTGKKVGVMSSDISDSGADNEILIGDENREEVRRVRRKLKDGEFGIEAVANGESCTVAVAYRGEKARMCAIQYLINKCYDAENQAISLLTGKAIVEKGTADNLFEYMGVDVVEDKRVIDNFIIHETSVTMRDPNAVYYNGYYYLYGTGWLCYRSTSLEGPWEPIEMIKHSDLETYGIKTAEKSNPWAPELHQYNGKFYLFTTYSCGAHDCDYKVKEYMKGRWQVPGGHRACIVLEADSPEGPFVPISKNANGELGHSTPDDIYTIDATLYVDRDGQPWMVYSKEWMTVDAPAGSFYAAKLSEDLSQFISEPQLVFEATLSPEDKSWKSNGCMDGEYFYRAKDGTLYMLWSPSVASGYSVAVARSESGELDGPWVAESDLLFAKDLDGGADGGHGSLFTDEHGQLWLVVHSPNSGAPERPTFIPLIEKDNKLVWGLAKSK
jgi:GH43 family beta-xylosidase